jgi:diaminobutyrate-2-oxoglutarate transaminase
MKDLSAFHLSEGARIVSESLPGPKSKEILEFQRTYEGSIVSYPVSMPIAVKRAKGACIEDVDGNRFIDFFSCAGVLNVGHCNEYVLEYVRKQQEEVIHLLDFPTENRVDLVRKLIEQLPGELQGEYKVSFCAPTGSDAVEAAIKLARHKTGRTGVIAFHGSYHGMTSGSLSVTSNAKFKERVSPHVPDIHFIPYSYCYRCPFGKGAGACELQCAEYLRYLLENPHSGISKPAAIILEPIQGEGGTVVPRAGFLEKIVQIARENDVVVIFDEIQCGFYRTGSLWEFQNSNVYPDIITMSKGLGGVGFPISAILYRKAIESWGPGMHVGTFRGNQVSIAAGRGAFDFVETYGIARHVRQMGAYLMARLEALKEKYPCIGEVRGRGLFIGIEYVTDPVTRRPDPQVVKQIRKACFNNGLLFETGGHFNNVIRFIPPLIVTREICDNALDIFENAHACVLNGVEAVPAG